MRQSIQEWTEKDLWKTAFKFTASNVLGPFLNISSQMTLRVIYLKFGQNHELYCCNRNYFLN